MRTPTTTATAPTVVCGTAPFAGTAAATTTAAAASMSSDLLKPQAQAQAHSEAQASAMSLLFDDTYAAEFDDAFVQQQNQKNKNNTDATGTDEDDACGDGTGESASTFWDLLTCVYIPLFFLWFRRSTFGSLNLIRSLILGHCLRLVFTTATPKAPVNDSSSAYWTIQIPEWTQQYFELWRTTTNSKASANNPHAWPPPALTALAILTIFALVVHPDGLTWILLRKIRNVMVSLFHASTSCWAVMIQDYGIFPTVAASATFAVLASLAIIMHKTLSPRSPGKQKRPIDSGKKKKKRKGHHIRGRGGRIKTIRKQSEQKGESGYDAPQIDADHPQDSINGDDYVEIDSDDDDDDKDNYDNDGRNDDNNVDDEDITNDHSDNHSSPDADSVSSHEGILSDSQIKSILVPHSKSQPSPTSHRSSSPRPESITQPTSDPKPISNLPSSSCEQRRNQVTEHHRGHRATDNFSARKKMSPQKTIKSSVSSVSASTVASTPSLTTPTTEHTSSRLRISSVSTLDSSFMSDDLSCGSMSVRSAHSIATMRPSEKSRKNGYHKARNPRNPRSNNSNNNNRRGKKFNNKEFINNGGPPSKANAGQNVHPVHPVHPSSRWDSLKPSHGGRYSRRNQGRGGGGAMPNGNQNGVRKVANNNNHNSMPSPVSPNPSRASPPVTATSPGPVPNIAQASVPIPTSPYYTTLPKSFPPVASPMTQSLFSCEVGASGWSPPPPLPAAGTVSLSHNPNLFPQVQERQSWHTPSTPPPPPGLGQNLSHDFFSASPTLPSNVDAAPTLWESSSEPKNWNLPPVSLNNNSATSIRTPPGLSLPTNPNPPAYNIENSISVFPPSTQYPTLTTTATSSEDSILFPSTLTGSDNLTTSLGGNGLRGVGEGSLHGSGGHPCTSSLKENPFDHQDDDYRIEAELQELGGRMIGSVLDF